MQLLFEAALLEVCDDTFTGTDQSGFTRCVRSNFARFGHNRFLDDITAACMGDADDWILFRLR